MVEIPITYRDQYATEKPNVLILTASLVIGAMNSKER